MGEISEGRRLILSTYTYIIIKERASKLRIGCAFTHVQTIKLIHAHNRCSSDYHHSLEWHWKWTLYVRPIRCQQFHLHLVLIQYCCNFGGMQRVGSFLTWEMKHVLPSHLQMEKYTPTNFLAELDNSKNNYFWPFQQSNCTLFRVHIDTVCLCTLGEMWKVWVDLGQDEG